MTGQPKKKLEEVDEFADRCFTTALNGCCVIPKHYMKRDRKIDPRDELGRRNRGVYELSLMLCIVSERLENMLREKNGMEPRRSRFDEIRDDKPDADAEELDVQFKRESGRLQDGDKSVLTVEHYS